MHPTENTIQKACFLGPRKDYEKHLFVVMYATVGQQVGFANVQLYENPTLIICCKQVLRIGFS